MFSAASSVGYCNAPANIAIFCNKGLREVRRVMVPYLGEAHDRNALVAAEQISRAGGIDVTIIHVVKPQDSAETTDPGGEDGQRQSPAPGITMQVIRSEDPNAAIIERSAHFDLMILGIADEAEASTPAVRHEALAAQSRCSLLLVHSDPRAPVVQTERVAGEVQSPDAESLQVQQAH